MTPRHKIILLALTPLIIALCAITLAVRHQAALLAQQQRSSVEAAYLMSKEAELRHYVDLAKRSIHAIYDSGRNDALAQEQAKQILARLDYGDDGYFFVYDMQGVNLVHPRQPELVGRNLWELRDIQGNPTIQRLIARARNGGGVERYLWEKPSSHKVVPKLGYVTSLPRWGWVLGTGIYLDDIDAVVNQIDTQISRNIQYTMLWIAGIAIASVLAIGLLGLALNFSEIRVADAKLKVLAQRVVRSQEDERARLSRDLHDGISQWLVSIKLQIESGIAKLALTSETASAHTSFDRAASQMNDILGEVRRISHDLRPALLDDLGLTAALERLSREFSEHAAVPVEFIANGAVEALSDVRKTVLFRIAQEALTNVQRHAHASMVHLTLTGEAKLVRLTISDNGCGFNTALIAQNPKRGIGLRNIHERVEAVDGALLLTSSDAGTQLIATLPLT
ncbi:MAG: cache domain-containing protein [Pseudomonadota bacterium]|nr:cache domain-containing protein [Pseudomonadota bacterium]